MLRDNEENIVAILPKEPAGSYWVFDYASSKELELDQITQKNCLLIVHDAKAFIKEHGLKLAPRPLLCLSTVKKILSHHQSELSLPALANVNEAQSWLKKALEKLLAELSKKNLEALALLECQFIFSLLNMERAGLFFNVEKWQNRLFELEEIVAQLKSNLKKYFADDEGFALFASEDFDLNNSQEVKTKLEKIVGQSLPNTSSSTLKKLEHEAAHFLASYREHSRMLATYGENFIAKIKNDRICGTFVATASASGRLTCLNPNLQALPNDQYFQACLKPYEPLINLHFDYSGFELRILASLSDDENLKNIFNQDEDIHSATAMKIFQKKVSKTENLHLREQAKLLSFGIIYGMGESALARQLNMSLDDAKGLMAGYFRQFKKVKEYLDYLENKARKNGEAKTLLGRKVTLDLTDKNQSSHFLRVARNHPIQGTGAEIAKLAMIKLDLVLEKSGLKAQIVNMVHDEIVVEGQKEEANQLSSLAEAAMTEAFSALCPDVKAKVSLTLA